MTGAALGVLAFLAPQVASAQCEQRLERAVAAIGTLPDGVDGRVHDQIVDLHDAAGGNDGRCVEAGVARMEEVLRRNGTRIEGDVASAGAGAATSGASGAGYTPGLIQVTPPTPFALRLPTLLAALAPQRRAEVEAISEYVGAVRGLGVRMAQTAAPSSPAQANEIAQTANTTIEAAESFQEVLVNQRGDQLHAQLEDAFRNFEEAQQTWEDHLNRLGSENSVERLRLIQARSRLRSVHDRMNKWLLDELGEGRAPGYAAAFAALEARHQQENRAIDAQCDARNETAQVQLARDYLAGDRNSTAITDAISDCEAISIPVRRRQLKEWDELEIRFAVTPGVVEEVTEDESRPRTRTRRAPPQPTAPSPSEPADDLLAPLVPSGQKAPAATTEPADDLLAPLTPSGGDKTPAAEPADDLLAPLTPSSGDKAPAAEPTDDLLAPLTPSRPNTGSGPRTAGHPVVAGVGSDRSPPPPLKGARR